MVTPYVTNVICPSNARLPHYIVETDEKGFKKPTPAIPASQRNNGKEDKEEKAKPKANSDKEAQQYV